MWFPRSHGLVTGPIEADPVHAEGFRPDVEGLRGIAILMVLLFHGALPVPGGFVGVDVFFVISGFLITGMLLREVTRTGTIALDRFFARRIRRLLPAALLVLAVTLPLTYLLVAPLDRSQAMNDGISAVLSTSNIRFALAEGDYFAAVNGPSPFLHFWSLSLEEQFYLFWPLLLLLVARHGRVRLRAALALGSLLVASLAASVLLTEMSTAWAFYSLPTRAWQFAAGGLLAIGIGLVGRVPGAAASVAGWVGVGVLAGSALLLDGSLPYPGVAAVAPTAAAVLLIASGERRWGPGRLLATTPLRFLGRISYSLYLWHWPILVLPAAALGVVLEPTTALALSGVSIVVAWASWKFVESPFQRPMAKSSWAPRRSLALGATAMAMVVALGGALDVFAVRAMSAPVDADVGTAVDTRDTIDTVALMDDFGPVVGADGTESDVLLSTATVAPGTPTPGTQSATPSLATMMPATAPQTAPQTAVAPAAWRLSIPKDAPEGPIRLPKKARPSLTDARGDIERLFADGCITQTSGTRPANCVYGDRKGSLTIALVGDSHASHWFPAFNILANRNGWRLLPYVKVSCPFVDMPVFNLLTKREYPECATWLKRVIAKLNDVQPDLVVAVSGYRAISAAHRADVDPERQGKAMARAVAQLHAPVAIMIDSPRASYDIPACLSRHRDDVRACAIPRAQAFPDQFGVREQIAAETTGAGLLDMVAAICPATPCQVARDGMILYRDNHHLTATFVRSLAKKLGVALAPFLPGAEPPAATPATPATPVPVSVPLSSPASSPPASPSPGPVAAPRTEPGVSVRLEFETTAGPRVKAADGSGTGSLEPVVATHPSDPAILAIAYGRATKGVTGVAGITGSVRVSKDGGRTWRDTRRRPCDGSGRRPSLHSAVAFGPGPSGPGHSGAARLYWTGTTTAGTGGVRVATAYSDDLGATWSRLHVVNDTPAWVGGFPDITVDRDPASPSYGVVYIAYNFPQAKGHGAGIRLLASSDLGRSWHGVNVRQAGADRRYPVSWRFGSRVHAAPDGTVYVSTYQADLRSWDPADVFDRGGPANAGRVGFAVTRLSFDRDSGRFSASPTTMATTIERNAYTTSRRAAPGTRSHTYLDPMWSHGLDVDPVSGSVFLAIADVSAKPAAGQPRGAVRIGRSDDAGRTWTWTTLLQAASIHGLRQSSFKPTLVVRGPVVFVGLHTIDDVAAAVARSADARIGNAYAISVDGGRTFTTPKLVSPDRWRASALEGAVNGPGLRDRAELTADGRVAYAYGDARVAPAKPARAAGPRQLYVALLSVDLPPPSSPR